LCVYIIYGMRGGRGRGGEEERGREGEGGEGEKRRGEEGGEEGEKI
jgi:hypothetical protein